MTTLSKDLARWDPGPANLDRALVVIAAAVEVLREAVLEVGAADTVAVTTNLRRPILSV